MTARCDRRSASALLLDFLLLPALLLPLLAFSGVRARALSGCLRPLENDAGGIAGTAGLAAEALPGVQRRFNELLAKIVALPDGVLLLTGGWAAIEPFQKDLLEVMEDSQGSAKVLVVRKGADVYKSADGRPVPCLASMVATELLQIVYVYRVEGDVEKATAILLASHDRLAWLRNVPWEEVFAYAWGGVFSAAQAACELLRPSASATSGSSLLSAVPAEEASGSREVFLRYRDLYGFDYLECMRRFVGFATSTDDDVKDAREWLAPIACDGGSAEGRQLWPHRRWGDLLSRLPGVCGMACKMAASFAKLAQLVLLSASRSLLDGPGGRCGAATPRLSEDEAMLLQEAQMELTSIEEYFKGHARGSEPSARFCRLARAIPLLPLLARASCLPERAVALPGRVSSSSAENLFGSEASANVPGAPSEGNQERTMAGDIFGCQEVVAGDSYVSGWPPAQRLTAAGALAMYTLARSVGGLLDLFGVRWWAAHATLLGALRHGGLLPQECDVDYAVWRGDAHALVSPRFRSALAFAGVLMFQLPSYLTFRFCLAHSSLLADHRSVDGLVSCRQPYVDAHLADRLPHGEERWDYIHRSDTRYADSFPLAGLFRVSEHGQVVSDFRRRVRFGEHAHVWAPQPETADAYLSALYGADWATTLRQRDGPRDATTGRPGLGAAVHSGNATSFQGLYAQPSGPLRDAVSELIALGGLPP